MRQGRRGHPEIHHRQAMHWILLVLPEVFLNALRMNSSAEGTLRRRGDVASEMSFHIGPLSGYVTTTVRKTVEALGGASKRIKSTRVIDVFDIEIRRYLSPHFAIDSASIGDVDGQRQYSSLFNSVCRRRLETYPKMECER